MDFTINLLISGLAALAPVENSDNVWVLFVNGEREHQRVCGYQKDLPLHSLQLTFRTENFVEYCEQVLDTPDRWNCYCPCRPCPTCEANGEGCTPQTWCPWLPADCDGNLPDLNYDTDGWTLAHIPISNRTIEIQDPHRPSPDRVNLTSSLFSGGDKPSFLRSGKRDIRWLARMKEILPYSANYLMPSTSPNLSLSARMLLNSGKLLSERLSRDDNGDYIVWDCSSEHRQVLAQGLEARLGEYENQVEIVLRSFDISEPPRRLVLRPTRSGERVEIGLSNLPDPHFPHQLPSTSVPLYHFYWYYTLETTVGKTFAEKLSDNCPLPSTTLSGTPALPGSVSAANYGRFASSGGAAASETCPLIRF